MSGNNGHHVQIGECSICHDKPVEVLSVGIPVYKEDLSIDGELQIPMCRECSRRNAV